MKITLTLFLLFSFTLCFGQFAFVKDPDGFVNVRASGDIKSNIIDSLDNDQLIFCFENLGNWTNIEYVKNGKECHGFIYSNRYTVLDSFTEASKSNQNDSMVLLSKDSLQIYIHTNHFIPQQHSIRYFKNHPDQIELIDGKKYWGRDGGMPLCQYEKIELHVEGKALLLPKTALENLYEPTLRNTQVNIDKATGTIYIQSMNSDGAGGYQVVWLIRNGEYLECLVVYGF